MKRFVAAFAVLALSACATPTPYQAADLATSSREGYSERRIENDRYTISFSGNSLTERNTVETYLLYRAAELTLENGFDYFVVTNRDVDRNSRFLGTGGYPGFRPYYNWYHPAWGWRPFYDPFWDDRTYREVTRYQATAEVQLRKGPKPADDPSAFDARQVAQNLQGSIVRPKGG